MISMNKKRLLHFYRHLVRLLLIMMLNFQRTLLRGLKAISLTEQEKEDFIELYNFHSPIYTHLFNQLTTSENGIDNSLCPYCTIGEASNLDHIRSKTIMPVFSDNPKEL